MAKYNPKTKEELQKLVSDESVYLGDIDTSNITTMRELFAGSQRTDFSGIEKWDTSKVKTMERMFAYVENFDKDISAWNVAKVKNMSEMFHRIYDKVKLPIWYLKWVEKNTNELFWIDEANAICKQLKVAYIVRVNWDYCIEEVLEKYPSRLQATWELKDRYENGDISERERDDYLVIGYEPNEISVKDLEPLVGMDIITADWLLRMGIHKAIAFDNTDGLTYGGRVGKIYGVYATRLDIIKIIEEHCPDEWQQGIDVQCIGYQPEFDVEKTFIGRDYLLLMDALRWVEWTKKGYEQYWWLEAELHDGEIIRIIESIYGSFDEAAKYKYELPPAEDDMLYVLGNNQGEWITSGGGEKRDEDEE